MYGAVAYAKQAKIMKAGYEDDDDGCRNLDDDPENGLTIHLISERY